MAYSIKKEEIITYPSETLKTFRVVMYEWIDNLNFTLKPEECLTNSEEYIKIAKELFSNEGWDGNGEIELMWIPPFMFQNTQKEEFTQGFVVWHVKQNDDGISWILTPRKLPCESIFSINVQKFHAHILRELNKPKYTVLTGSLGENLP